ncbi:MAG: hypothetical protein PHV34_10370 [Verrucomicrobiae bacterium]|nr:hypothetical protein [Verrucomicrobiae bacterium]
MENIMVMAIVAGALVFAGRLFYRTLTGKNNGCGCKMKSCFVPGACRGANGRK